MNTQIAFLIGAVFGGGLVLSGFAFPLIADWWRERRSSKEQQPMRMPLIVWASTLHSTGQIPEYKTSVYFAEDNDEWPEVIE